MLTNKTPLTYKAAEKARPNYAEFRLEIWFSSKNL